MTLIEATRKVMKASGHGIDAFTHSDYDEIRVLTKDTRSDHVLRLVAMRLRKQGKIGPVLGGKGPIKIDDVVCPYCGKRNGGAE